MNHFRQLSIDISDRKVATVLLNAADRSVNVFDEELLAEIRSVVEQIQVQSDIKLLVFRSSKPAGFLAGADVARIQSIATAEAANEALQKGQQLFEAVARLRIPTVAVIHGSCLGGGLEFALACRYRVAIDMSSTRLALPETQLGLIPGWGGTQRLPAIVGLSRAMSMILEGSQLSADAGLKAGLVDAVASGQDTEQDVSRFLEQCVSASPPKRRTRAWWRSLLEKTWPGQTLAFAFARRKIGRRAQNYPALPAALRAMEVGLTRGAEAGYREERSQFTRILFHPTTRNLLELFFQRERARKVTTWIPNESPDLVPIKRVAVIGGGTMGAGIAQLALTRGYQVVMKELNADLAAVGEQRVTALITAAATKGAIRPDAAERARSAFRVTTDWPLVREADLVIEAVVEKIDIKRQLFKELDIQLPDHVILASNTSALPIRELAIATARPDRVAGLHFFNPVHKMPLVEVVETKDTSQQTLVSLLEFSRTVGKTPLLVAEGPGFLINRILFSYLDEAVRLVLDGVSVEDVDREAKRFGLPMGPLELLDTVGLDIAADVAATLTVLNRHTSPTPEFLAGLLDNGHKGRKSGAGFYKYAKDRRGDATDLPIPPRSGMRQVASRRIAGEKFSGIQLRLIGALINAAAQAMSAEIVREAWMVDLGMVLGTGFPPFRGGPLRLAAFWGHDVVREVLDNLANSVGPRFAPDSWWLERVTDSHQR